MTDAGPLSTLADEEESIFRVVGSVGGTMQGKHERLGALGVYARYRSVFLSYLDLLLDREAGGEALKRATFLNWYDLAEPGCFTGLFELPEAGRRRLLARLDSMCADGTIDDELRWMLAHYQHIAAFALLNFGDRPNLQAFLTGVEEVTYFDAEVAPGQFEGRGQMGRYWRSLMESRAILRSWSVVPRKRVPNEGRAEGPVSDDLTLREVVDADLPRFFEFQRDPDAHHMAAFTAKDPSDREAFDRHWRRIRAEPTVVVRTVVCGGDVAGHVLSHRDTGEPEVAFWIDRARWGRGLATRALTAFLAQVHTERPVHARVAADNLGSRRVLEKCGFRIVGESKWFAHARGREIDELLLVLGSE